MSLARFVSESNVFQITGFSMVFRWLAPDGLINKKYDNNEKF